MAVGSIVSTQRLFPNHIATPTLTLNWRLYPFFAGGYYRRHRQLPNENIGQGGGVIASGWRVLLCGLEVKSMRWCLVKWASVTIRTSLTTSRSLVYRSRAAISH